jgi:SAM-dependent methyltransferase
VCRDGLQRRTEQVRAFLDLAGAAAGARLLDVGTADGRLLLSLRESHPGVRATGVEVSEELAREARARGLDVTTGDARALPFPDASFEVAVLAATLKHVPEPALALRECRRVLVAGGWLLVLDPTPWGVRWGIRRGHFDPRWLPNVWSLARTASEARAAGFEVVRSRRYMLLPVSWPGTRAAEAVVRALGLGRLLLQQALLARAR